MTTSSLLLLATAFGATAVEMVEALTIVLAMGMSRSWRSAGFGTAAALVVLALVIAIFGTALLQLPIRLLRLIVGLALLFYGGQWLRKAVLRASGRKALHDESAIFSRLITAFPQSKQLQGIDPVSFTVSFKGVFLEGLEAAIFVITIGSTTGKMPLAILGATAAVVVVGAVGVIVHRPLTKVPENTLKMGVGVVVTSFGTFWLGEAAGLSWPGSDLAVLGLCLAYSGLALLIVRMLRPHPNPA